MTSSGSEKHLDISNFCFLRKTKRKCHALRAANVFLAVTTVGSSVTGGRASSIHAGRSPKGLGTAPAQRLLNHWRGHHGCCQSATLLTTLLALEVMPYAKSAGPTQGCHLALRGCLGQAGSFVSALATCNEFPRGAWHAWRAPNGAVRGPHAVACPARPLPAVRRGPWPGRWLRLTRRNCASWLTQSLGTGYYKPSLDGSCLVDPASKVELEPFWPRCESLLFGPPVVIPRPVPAVFRRKTAPEGPRGCLGCAPEGDRPRSGRWLARVPADAMRSRAKPEPWVQARQTLGHGLWVWPSETTAAFGIAMARPAHAGVSPEPASRCVFYPALRHRPAYGGPVLGMAAPLCPRLKRGPYARGSRCMPPAVRRGGQPLVYWIPEAQPSFAAQGWPSRKACRSRSQCRACFARANQYKQATATVKALGSPKGALGVGLLAKALKPRRLVAGPRRLASRTWSLGTVGCLPLARPAPSCFGGPWAWTARSGADPRARAGRGGSPGALSGFGTAEGPVLARWGALWVQQAGAGMPTPTLAARCKALWVPYRALAAKRAKAKHWRPRTRAGRAVLGWHPFGEPTPAGSALAGTAVAEPTCLAGLGPQSSGDPRRAANLSEQGRPCTLPEGPLGGVRCAAQSRACLAQSLVRPSPGGTSASGFGREGPGFARGPLARRAVRARPARPSPPAWARAARGAGPGSAANPPRLGVRIFLGHARPCGLRQWVLKNTLKNATRTQGCAPQGMACLARRAGQTARSAWWNSRERVALNEIGDLALGRPSLSSLRLLLGLFNQPSFGSLSSKLSPCDVFAAQQRGRRF